jgi:3-isopropylmalate dehydrogenase
MTTIAVLPGDGIGPEVIAQAVHVLRHVRPDIECVEAPVGAAAIRQGLSPLPEEADALCRRSEAILFGSVGDAALDDLPFEQRPEAALFALRYNYGLYANVRPVRVYPGLEDASSVRSELIEGLDLVVVRELTGGIYFGTPKNRGVDTDGTRWAVDTMSYRAPEIERIARVAFELAARRRKRLTSVDKYNILATSRLWREVVNEVARAYPDVELQHLLVDNAAMQLVRRPGEFDVIVTENMFGDILSDETAILSGSIGNLPSASLKYASYGRTFGMYEPIGGTAPDIAGKGIANPTAAILSAALLLRYSLDDETSAQSIEAAVERVFAQGVRTRDLALPHEPWVGSQEFGDAVLRSMKVPV